MISSHEGKSLFGEDKFFRELKTPPGDKQAPTHPVA